MSDHSEDLQPADYLKASLDMAREAEIRTLEWCMNECLSGRTIQMLRRAFYNRLVEIKGEGEKA